MQSEVLDLCSCRGGATVGYQRAGARVTGVDIAPQPDYPGDEFHQCDAVTFVRENMVEIRRRYVMVSASPPCQGEGAPNKGTNKARNDAKGFAHPQLIKPIRAALEELGLPYVIENVDGSSVRKDLTLCGDHFDLGVIMHRHFEFGGGLVPPPLPPNDSEINHSKHKGRVRGWRHKQYFDGPYVAAYGKGGGKATVEEMRQAKGIDWTWDHLALREALPPVYMQYIGEHALAQLGSSVAA